MAKRAVGRAFQEGTKYLRGAPPPTPPRSTPPDPVKTYPGATRIALSQPLREEGAPLWSTLRERRSIRRFDDSPLEEAALSQILWAAQGVTRIRQRIGFRTAPSAGALYPVETYAVVHRVEGVAPGVYHYFPPLHALDTVSLGDRREEVAAAALDQAMARQAAVVLLWTAVFARSTWKYGERAYRYIYLDAGHIAENAALAATALGLGSCQIAALYDEECNALLGIDGREESILYMTVVGRPAG